MTTKKKTMRKKKPTLKEQLTIAQGQVGNAVKEIMDLTHQLEKERLEYRAEVHEHGVALKVLSNVDAEIGRASSRERV